MTRLNKNKERMKINWAGIRNAFLISIVVAIIVSMLCLMTILIIQDDKPTMIEAAIKEELKTSPSSWRRANDSYIHTSGLMITKNSNGCNFSIHDTENKMEYVKNSCRIYRAIEEAVAINLIKGNDDRPV